MIRSMRRGSRHTKTRTTVLLPATSPGSRRSANARRAFSPNWPRVRRKVAIRWSMISTGTRMRAWDRGARPSGAHRICRRCSPPQSPSSLGKRSIRCNTKPGWAGSWSAQSSGVALLDGFAEAARRGIKEHDRWLLARRQLDRRPVGRRSNSSLPALADLVAARPILSAGLIAREVKVTPRAAQDLVAALDLREMTGRGRYRAWGKLWRCGNRSRIDKTATQIGRYAGGASTSQMEIANSGRHGQTELA